jgi:thiamine-monophosphate kinase
MSATDEGGEFAEIARLFAPLTRGAPEALSLLDDAAVLAGRSGFDLVITTDALVEGVHFLPDDPLDTVARKLLRVNLSDLAAKGAAPFGYLLTTAWSARCDAPARRAFANGLARDGETYGLILLGGDTVSTPGPLTVSATMLGWVPAGAMVKRSGARAGDRLLVSGQVGKGWLGLQARRGAIADPDGGLTEYYRLPQPRVALAEALRRYARAAADVSDGLIADAGHIATASGLGLTLSLDDLPLPRGMASDAASRVAAATGGDDYEIVCAASPDTAPALIAAAAVLGLAMTEVGVFTAGDGRDVRLGGRSIAIEHAGWRHL